MYYEINVASQGQHLFATAPRSLWTAEHTKFVYNKLRKAFPERDGYTLTVTFREEVGTDRTATFESMAKHIEEGGI